jgi:hypothetical protein
MASAPDFFSLLPRRSGVLFFAAVFCTFAPLSLLVVSHFAEAPPSRAVLGSWLLSGGVAVCWAATFIVSRWFIIGIVGFQATMIVYYTSWGQAFFDSDLGGGRISLEGTGATVAIVVGYVLFVIFISGQGKTTIRLRTEMDLAREIHETLVPPVSLRDEGFEVHGFSSASTEMGGDLIDVVRHDKGTDIVLADVSGHGVRAGVVMGMLKSAVRAKLQAPCDLDQLLTGLNRLLEETTSSGMFATVVALRIVDTREQLEYAIAGHDCLLQLRPRTGEATRIENRHMPLGLFDQTCRSDRLAVEPGDLLAV